MKLSSEMRGMGASRVGAASLDSFQTSLTVASPENYQPVWTLIRRGRGSEGTVTASVNTSACGGLEGRALYLSLLFVGHSHTILCARPTQAPERIGCWYRSPNFCT